MEIEAFNKKKKNDSGIALDKELKINSYRFYQKFFLDYPLTYHITFYDFLVL